MNDLSSEIFRKPESNVFLCLCHAEWQPVICALSLSVSVRSVESGLHGAYEVKLTEGMLVLS